MQAAGVSFRTMLFAMIAAVVVPLAALLLFAIHQAFERRADAARESARHLAVTAAAAIDQSFTELRRSVEAAAARYDLDASSDACARFLGTVTALQPDAAYVSFGDRNGDVRCSGLPPPAGRRVNVANLPEFQKPLTEGVSVVGEPQVGRLPGVHQVMVAAPVRDRSGAIAGVLAIAVELGVIQRLASTVVSDARTTFSVITPGGVMIAHAPDPGQWVDRKVGELPEWRAILDRGTAPVEQVRLDGVERILGVAKVPSTGWMVVAGLPEAETLAPVRRGAWLSLGLALGVVLTAAGLATFLARRLSWPVDGIVAAMQRAASGAPDARAPEGGPKEIALIGAEFNRMLAARTRLEAERHEALARAAAHEHRLANTFEAMAEAVGIIGADGRYELTNHAAEQFLGVPRERIIGSRFDDVPWKQVSAGGAVLGRDDHPFERLRRGAPAVRDYEFQVVLPAGKARTLSVNAMPLRDANGAFDGIVITGIDTTERRAAERRLREVIETLAEGLVIIGADGRYELANRAEEELLGVPREQLVGTRFDAAPFGRATAEGAAFPIEDHPFTRLQRGEPPMRDYEFQLVPPGGKVRTVLVNAAPLRDVAGNFDGIVATCIDISERKRAERRLGDIIEALAEGLILIGADGRYELTNRAEEELLGVPRERIVGTFFDAVPWARLTPDGAPFRVADHPFARLRRGEPLVRDCELQLVSPAGRARTVLASAVPLRDAAGDFDGAVLSAVDITERKRAERRIAEYSERLAALSRRVLMVQEEERRAVARELHDELGQVLTAVKVNLQALRRQSAPAQFGPGFDDSLALLDGAIAEVRAIATRLRPTVLDDLGLEAALTSHLDRIRARAVIDLAIDIRLPQRRLDPAVETACFRIVQEAVTNALRHARARRVHVGLGVEDRELALAVRDDGAGFDLGAATQRAARDEAAGLSGMEERARLAGGRLEIHTAPGRGTEVRALFRLEEASAEAAE
jgi:PAS domain S-box-containing protein